ncbi:MdtA/MuxA family multidrug efflux RND transporter periplasmic adaptor subunit [Geobacter sp. AOG1]|uniref:MdtA/MuxA family multidrug efflux RND transporter periplasmic adaptor subunit n=1 Tax=Geobacter sp. AOG1 TaxID=1566346 RepID=UPI001CC63349|nr:MdtA/MuxA family multidrug efflux RND transporter periplasmic adaptor subunit [Geobacter sp. AOG1]GFE58829.1 multidrug transporter [Geobacter sp. AOG1]
MQENGSETIESNPHPAKRPFFKQWWFWIILLCLIAGGFFAVWKERQLPSSASAAGKKGAVLPMPVFVAAARTGDMNLYLTGLGSVTPLNTVTVRSRVDGQLMEVHFREGQNVTKGSLLAVIDPRPFQVQLTQAEGQMARDREQLNNARLDLERYRTLWRQDSIPRQQLDTQEALVRQNEGAVKIDQGQIDSARLNLTYSRITAPISGRAGLRLVDPGNMVHATDTGGLLTITQVQPIAVVFPLPEDSLPQVLQKMKGGRLTVEAFDREMKQNLAAGELATVDNQIDPATGTVKLKAVFANRNSELFPNQFVNARLLLDVKKDAIIIPSAAIQRNPQGAFVFVLRPDKTVAMRAVRIGITQGGEATVVEGLAVGEQVVVDGAERLREGSKVEVKEKGRTPNK